MKIKYRVLSSVPTAALVGVALMASGVVYASETHGKMHGDKMESHHSGNMPDIGSPGAASDVSRTIKVTLGDNFFEPENIDVKKDETVRFEIVNNGEFVHEFNIGTALMHASHQKEMMMMMEHGAIEADRINHDKMMMKMGDGKMMAHDDPNSVLLEPGKSAEIIWKFSEDQSLEFACNIPGHYQSGMVGDIRVN